MKSGLWKSEVVLLTGVWLIAAAFIVPSTGAVYNNWLLGFVASVAALMLSGNRKWERPVAATAAIWLFISGFVPSVLQGGPWVRNELIIAAALVIAGISAQIHLRDDLRAHRPLAM
jgi:hypothetical protein